MYYGPKKGSTIHEESSGVSPERMEFGSKIRLCQRIWHNTTMNKKYEKQVKTRVRLKSLALMLGKKVSNSLPEKEQAERKEGQSWAGKL